MTKRITLTLFIAALVLGGSAYGGYDLYQHHISGSLRHILVAALDQHATDEEINRYIYAARLAVRTKRDAEVLADYEQAHMLFEQAIDLQAGILSNSQIALDCFNRYNQPSDTQAQLKMEIKEEQECGKEEFETQKLNNKTSKKDMDEAVKLFNKISLELGVKATFKD